MKLADLLPRLPDEFSFVVVDPGKRCGALVLTPGEPWAVTDFPLDELPCWLAGVVGLVQPAFVACESFSLTGGNRRNDPSMPAPRGIGHCEAICALTETPLVMLPRNVKTAGHRALDTDGTAAFTTARNDHRRDVVDLAGYAAREIRAYRHNYGLRA